MPSYAADAAAIITTICLLYDLIKRKTVGTVIRVVTFLVVYHYVGLISALITLLGLVIFIWFVEFAVVVAQSLR